MLVTPTRIAYRGLFGKPGERIFGAWIYYVALEQPLQISVGGAAARSERIALIPPHVPHHVSTQDRELIQILIEAETVAGAAALESLIDSPRRRAETMMRIRAGFEKPLRAPEEFDRQFFGHELPARVLDARIARAIAHMSAHCAEMVTAEECAAKVGLSFSRFTHLFSREIHTTFRRVRAWKRARGLMSMMGSGPNLVKIALDAGYADATHFSHAIRQFYGYSPREIFAGSRRLAVVSRWPLSAAVASRT
jgi:AraC-like DNA-binding protein